MPGQVNHDLGGAGDLLGGLAHESVAKGTSTRGLLRGSFRGRYRQQHRGVAEVVNVDASGSTLDGLALGKRVERAGVLDALVASEHIAGSVNK